MKAKHHHTRLYLLLGLWVSFVGLMMAGSLLLPPNKKLADSSPALLYNVTRNEELHQAEAPALLPGKAMIADLDQMQLALYEDNVRTKTFPILSRGREGTFWETPTGKYAIQTKEPKHFSSIGGTWMPYSMQFYGNFFIHGWPTDQNGDNVPTGYSGGCIRLATSDAREVYEFADIGTRILVTGGESRTNFATSSQYYLHGDGKLPDIKSNSFIVADADLGKILWERRAHEYVNPRGLTLLMTALTALETVDQYKVVRMGELLLGKTVLRKSSIGAADEIPAGTLIYPMLFDGNDTAALAFAREHGTKRFVAYMNEKATAVGMNETQFGGARGSDESTTTPYDLLTLLSYVDRSKHFLIDVGLTPLRTLYDSEGEERYKWTNKNPWVLGGDAAYEGGIAALNNDGVGGSAMLLFNLPLSEFGDKKISFVILDSPNLREDVSALRQFVEAHFVYGLLRDTNLTREPDEATPSLLEKAEGLIHLEHLLQDDVSYERDT